MSFFVALHDVCIGIAESLTPILCGFTDIMECGWNYVRGSEWNPFQSSGKYGILIAWMLGIIYLWCQHGKTFHPGFGRYLVPVWTLIQNRVNWLYIQRWNVWSRNGSIFHSVGDFHVRTYSRQSRKLGFISKEFRFRLFLPVLGGIEWRIQEVIRQWSTIFGRSTRPRIRKRSEVWRNRSILPRFRWFPELMQYLSHQRRKMKPWRFCHRMRPFQRVTLIRLTQEFLIRWFLWEFSYILF